MTDSFTVGRTDALPLEQASGGGWRTGRARKTGKICPWRSLGGAAAERARSMAKGAAARLRTKGQARLVMAPETRLGAAGQARLGTGIEARLRTREAHLGTSPGTTGSESTRTVAAGRARMATGEGGGRMGTGEGSGGERNRGQLLLGTEIRARLGKRSEARLGTETEARFGTAARTPRCRSGRRPTRTSWRLDRKDLSTERLGRRRRMGGRAGRV